MGGRMRIIDADKLKAHYAWWKGGSREMTMDEAKSDFDTIIDLQPTVDVVPAEDYRSMEQTVYKLTQALAEAEPTKHGRWIEEKDEYDDIWCKCSECGYTNMGCEVFNLDGFRYCPNCGARMDTQIGEDKSHPFAESVMMGMDGGENG